MVKESFVREPSLLPFAFLPFVAAVASLYMILRGGDFCPEVGVKCCGDCCLIGEFEGSLERRG